MAIGLAIGAPGGILLGLWLGRSPRVASLLYPFVVVLNSVPVVALAPLLIMWFGLGMEPKVALVALVSFLLLFFNTFAGAQAVDRDLIESLALMGANRREQFRMAIAPACLTWIFAGLKNALPYALIAATIGEMMVARAGLGFPDHLGLGDLRHDGTLRRAGRADAAGRCHQYACRALGSLVLALATRGGDAAMIWLGRAAILLGFLAAWQLASGRLIPKMFVSDPVSIGMTIAQWIQDGSLWNHVATSLITLLIGYVLGAAIGIAAGFLLGLMRFADRTLAPFIAAFYGLPKVALLPLFVIFLGIGIESKVALVAVVVAFLLFYNTRDGVRDIDPDLIDSLRLLGATQFEILRKVLFPAALPWIYTGLRVAVGYALTTTVVGEVLSSNRGIGYLIESSAGRFNSAGVFAAVVVLVVLSLIITATLSRMELSSSRWRM